MDSLRLNRTLSKIFCWFCVGVFCEYGIKSGLQIGISSLLFADDHVPFIVIDDKGVYSVDSQQKITRLSSPPKLAVPAEDGLVGVFYTGTYYLKLDGSSKLLTLSKPSAMVPVPGGFVGTFRTGTHFVDFKGKFTWLSNRPSHMVPAGHGFIGSYTNGVAFTDLEGNYKFLTQDRPWQMVPALGGFVGKYDEGSYFRNFDGQTKWLNDEGHLLPAPEGFISVHLDGTYYTRISDPNSYRISNRPGATVAAPLGFIGDFEDGYFYININKDQVKLAGPIQSIFFGDLTDPKIKETEGEFWLRLAAFEEFRKQAILYEHCDPISINGDPALVERRCPICQENIETLGQVVRLKACGDVYCNDCLKQSFFDGNQKKCALCRKAIEKPKLRWWNAPLF